MRVFRGAQRRDPSRLSMNRNVGRSRRGGYRPGEVEKVEPSKIPSVTLQMETLAQLRDGADAQAQLGGFVTQYKQWIKNQGESLGNLSPHRLETTQELLHRANIAADRIQAGIDVLGDPQCLEAFRIANKAMAAQGRRRLALQWNKSPEEITPEWRAFQLAFILMNLRGIADPIGNDRELVDLLFFPTGGGKTEAYLGLAAFTLVLRRLRNPGLSSAGLSVLMRYTLRLLTLDQLGRAAALICALELERQQDVEKLGEWPFEIGLWVGMAATPNRMGRKGDTDSHLGAAKDHRLQERRPQTIAHPFGRMSLVRHEVPVDLIPTAAKSRRSNGPSRHLRQSTLRLFARQQSSHLGRGRAHLSSAALLPDRHGRQVRCHAVDR